MLSIPFSKYEAAQNDFVIIDNREQWFPKEYMKSFTRKICHRRKGIGADGVIFIERSAQHNFTMLFFNPDGSDGSMCGNGGRCAILFASIKNIAQSPMTFKALGQVYSGEINNQEIRLYFPTPKKIEYNIKLQILNQSMTLHYAHVGAPHVVAFLDDIEEQEKNTLEELNISRYGKAIRHTPEFSPEGVNANFLQIDSDNVVHIRTFEKGVEAETESCGTGTIASALIASKIRNLQPPIRLLSHGGDLLNVGFEVDYERVKKLYIEGPANFVFSGSINYEPE